MAALRPTRQVVLPVMGRVAVQADSGIARQTQVLRTSETFQVSGLRTTYPALRTLSGGRGAPPPGPARAGVAERSVGVTIRSDPLFKKERDARTWSGGRSRDGRDRDGPYPARRHVGASGGGKKWKVPPLGICGDRLNYSILMCIEDFLDGGQLYSLGDGVEASTLPPLDGQMG
jgi:hypothetical protein